MNLQELRQTAQAMVADGQGILAADESNGTITKRFDAVGIESTEDSRRDYRQMLVGAPGAGDFISGMILYDETIRQKAADGQPMVDFIKRQNIIPGIKVDKGAKPMALSENEKVTEGLDGLRERMQEYYEMGARFAKWRAVVTIGDGIPTRGCILANAHALARYAALCQENNVAPIVEPEVLIDGDHSVDQCYEVTRETLETVFDQLRLLDVALDGMVLKPNMVISGKEHSHQSGSEEVARYTVECLLETVPGKVPGVAFLSGGQSDKQATANLQAMNELYPNPPWQLTFSYARALQDQPMKIWNGDNSNAEEAQRVFSHRAKMNSAARSGKYSENLETAA